MKKVILMAAVAVMAAVGANAQTPASRPSAEATQSVQLSILGLHYAHELPLARRMTLTGRVGADVGIAVDGDLFGNHTTTWMAAPTIDIEPRFYYGLDRRASLGRSTVGNAGSFLALRVKNMMPLGWSSDKGAKPVGATFIAPMWGMRRLWGEHWQFEFTAGANIGIGWKGKYGWTPHASVRFGYSF